MQPRFHRCVHTMSALWGVKQNDGYRTKKYWFKKIQQYGKQGTWNFQSLCKWSIPLNVHRQRGLGNICLENWRLWRGWQRQMFLVPQKIKSPNCRQAEGMGWGLPSLGVVGTTRESSSRDFILGSKVLIILLLSYLFQGRFWREKSSCTIRNYGTLCLRGNSHVASKR